MKKILVIILSLIVLGGVGFAGWYLFISKKAEGEPCNSNTRCEQGLKCLQKECSSGAIGSSCEQKNDCVSGFCVSGTCFEGKINDSCKTYSDCQAGLLCLKSSCSNPPDYSKYFSKINVSKIKPGLAPGTNNPSIATTEFDISSDAIEVDLIGVKSGVKGEFYFEIIDSITGETALSTISRQGISKVEGQDTGIGTDLSGLNAGGYDLNIYFNNELVFSTTITLN